MILQKHDEIHCAKYHRRTRQIETSFLALKVKFIFNKYYNDTREINKGKTAKTNVGKTHRYLGDKMSMAKPQQNKVIFIFFKGDSSGHGLSSGHGERDSLVRIYSNCPILATNWSYGMFFGKVRSEEGSELLSGAPRYSKRLWSTWHCGMPVVCLVPVPISVSLLTGSNLITCHKGVQRGLYRLREAENNKKRNSKNIFVLLCPPTRLPP
jgi:hypothetical protein